MNKRQFQEVGRRLESASSLHAVPGSSGGGGNGCAVVGESGVVVSGCGSESHNAVEIIRTVYRNQALCISYEQIQFS